MLFLVFSVHLDLDLIVLSSESRFMSGEGGSPPQNFSTYTFSFHWGMGGGGGGGLSTPPPPPPQKKKKKKKNFFIYLVKIP